MLFTVVNVVPTVEILVRATTKYGTPTGRMIPHGSNMPPMQQLPSPGRAEHAEILESDLPRNALTCIIDHKIYNIPGVAQSHIVDFNSVRGPTASSCNND